MRSKLFYQKHLATIAEKHFELTREAIRESFSPIMQEHRMEHVATIYGVEYMNDSKSTNINSTWFTLESMYKPIVLIMGGVDKGNDYNMITELVAQKVKAIICLGTDNKKIKHHFKNIVPAIYKSISMVETVLFAQQLAMSGDMVLLSPASASFDLFENYEDRGRQFKQAVKRI